jgi:hypothetical protein
MSTEIRKYSAVLAVGLVVGYVAIACLSDLWAFAPLPGGLLWMAIAPLLCGLLLCLASRQPGWSLLAVCLAGILATVVFGLVWTYSLWELADRHLSFLDLAGSTPVMAFVLQRGLVIFGLNAMLGFLGTVLAALTLRN